MLRLGCLGKYWKILPSNLLGSHSPPSEVVLKEGETRIWSECFFCNNGRILEYMLKEKGLCLRKLCSYILLFRNIVDFWVYVEVESLGTFGLRVDYRELHGKLKGGEHLLYETFCAEPVWTGRPCTLWANVEYFGSYRVSLEYECMGPVDFSRSG